jgi:hypothetical protein
MPLGMSHVALCKGVPVALNTCWDFAEGGVWKDSGLTMPASMEAHAEVGKGVFDRVNADRLENGDDSRLLFAAFGGIEVPHSSKLFGLMGMIGFQVAKSSGFKKSMQYTVLQKTVMARIKKSALGNIKGAHKVLKPVVFEDVAAENEATRAELKELGGIAKVGVGHMTFMTSDLYVAGAAAASRATPEEIQEAFPMAERQLALLQGRASPISRL